MSIELILKIVTTAVGISAVVVTVLIFIITSMSKIITKLGKQIEAVQKQAKIDLKECQDKTCTKFNTAVTELHQKLKEKTNINAGCIDGNRTKLYEIERRADGIMKEVLMRNKLTDQKFAALTDTFERVTKALQGDIQGLTSTVKELIVAIQKIEIKIASKVK